MKRYAIELRVHPVLRAKNPDAADRAQAQLDRENPLDAFRTLRGARRALKVLKPTDVVTESVIIDRRTGLVVP